MDLKELCPWMFETHEERARRVCAEADRLQLLHTLKTQWRANAVRATAASRGVK